VEFDVATSWVDITITAADAKRWCAGSQASYRNDMFDIPRAAPVGVLTNQLDPKLVFRGRGALLLGVDRPHSKEHIPKKVGPGCATDVAVVRGTNRRKRAIRTLCSSNLVKAKVPQNFRTAYV
jgi:hypothetical protein